MAGATQSVVRICCLTAALVLGVFAVVWVNAQTLSPAGGPDQVTEVRVEGLRAIQESKVRSLLETRVGRTFDQQQFEKDVRKLVGKGWFLDVQSSREFTQNGVVVTIKVAERPTLQYVKYLGNKKVKSTKLAKETELKKGNALDPYAVEEGKRKIEAFYESKGYSNVQVTIMEGTKMSDRGAVFLINEGQLQKVWSVSFIGNTIASDARLKTQIQSKPPILWLFKGYADRKKIDEDVEKLTEYYRSLGFFQAKIGRELEFNEEQNWLTLTFVVNEGARYRLRNVAFIGNQKYGSEQLGADLKLKPGDFFDQGKMNKDVSAVRDMYGSVGHVFANVQAEPRFFEEPGQLDLIYSVEEGDVYRVGAINVHIEGENPHTRHSTVLNRISLRPGDIIDTRKIRDSERRLRASGLFMADPTKGSVPKIVFSPPESDGSQMAERKNRSGGFRGQSPDGATRVRTVNLTADCPPYATGRAPVDAGGVKQTTNAQSRPTPRSVDHRQGALDQSAHAAHARSAATDKTRSTHLANLAAQKSVFDEAAPQAVRFDMRHVATTRNSTPPAGQRSNRKLSLGATVSSDDGAAASFTIDEQNWLDTSERMRSQGGGTEAQPRAVGRPQFHDSVAEDLTIRGQSPGGVFRDPNIRPAQYQPFGGRAVPSIAPDPQPHVVNQYPPNGYAPAPGPPPLGAAPQGVPVEGLMGNPPLLQDSPILADPGPQFYETPERYIPLDAYSQETQTGRFMFGVGVNSDAGLVGSIVLDEQNFDWRRVPTSFEDFRNGTAFRGAGQRFRLEAAPGTEVQRYLFNFQDPYLNGTPVSFGLSGFFYDRRFRDYDEERLGGRISLGYLFTPDLSGTVALRAEQIDISKPHVPTPQDLLDVLGTTNFYSVKGTMVHDTRDSTFLPTQGHYIELGFEQAFGDFVFPRMNLDMRQHFVLHERPDTSGRHVLSLVGRFGVSGEDTPLYERFFAGGFSTIRGFAFRGASPVDLPTGVTVGGELQALGTVEYLFPITADDMLRGVTFVDFGTVERTAHIESDNFRVAPGFGLRVSIPALGPAPIALDFAFPVLTAEGDREQMFSFFVGFGR